MFNPCLWHPFIFNKNFVTIKKNRPTPPKCSCDGSYFRLGPNCTFLLNSLAPKETQRLPLTATQKYGWWVPQDRNVKAEYVHTWIEVPRYPMINSPMTR
uniref:Uncharacterized protein n=1 Tax=Leptobrachium leishanense TaxID=445787 RepID=A0A8C5M0S9_9ANUR